MTFSTSDVAVCCSSDSIDRSALAQLSRSRVFSMAMTACAAKFSHQFDLLVGERANFLAEDHDGADQRLIVDHGTASCVRTKPSFAMRLGCGSAEMSILWITRITSRSRSRSSRGLA